MTRRAIFVFGLALGAWLNIWPAGIADSAWASFVFAYVLVFTALVVFLHDRMRAR